MIIQAYNRTFLMAPKRRRYIYDLIQLNKKIKSFVTSDCHVMSFIRWEFPALIIDNKFISNNHITTKESFISSHYMTHYAQGAPYCRNWHAHKDFIETFREIYMKEKKKSQVSLIFPHPSHTQYNDQLSKQVWMQRCLKRSSELLIKFQNPFFSHT